MKSRIAKLNCGDEVLLETRAGDVITGAIDHIIPASAEAAQRAGFGHITRIIRVVTDKDRDAQETREQRERDAKRACQVMIRQKKLPMKLAKVTLQGANKAIFHFTADARVDFRELVQELSKELQMRIEMRQVGVRDEAKMLGGMGACGQSLCCAQHLQKFHPVSVRMAKNQDLSLNPDAISGICGRLMCCLAYENDTYTELRKGLPKPKSRLFTSEGQEVTLRCVHPIARTGEVQAVEGGWRSLVSLDDLLQTRPGQEEAAAQPAMAQQGDETTEKGEASAPSTRKSGGGSRRSSREEGRGPQRRGARGANSASNDAGLSSQQNKSDAVATQSSQDDPQKGGDEAASGGKRKSRRRRGRGRNKNADAAQNPSSAASNPPSEQNPTKQQTAPAGGEQNAQHQAQSPSGATDAPRKRRRRRRRKSGGGGDASNGTPPSGGQSGASGE
ncbi:putative PSP1 domain-containing protein [Magnetofaba australis IT-1]|uniref:Putative PSP1 domain-containing protein n=1 Tax=Magnetofaba australis IT-1 TaxID=1434232 RepID=A0A1Y2K6H6_9PROT|nr:putative PSP1 domain-containing protein [Magnetofaba australis IT-1]